MKIFMNWSRVQNVYDTKTLELVDLPARKAIWDKNAEIAIKDGYALSIVDIWLGDRESSNTFAKELVRRWNEFPEELKK